MSISNFLTLGVIARDTPKYYPKACRPTTHESSMGRLPWRIPRQVRFKVELSLSHGTVDYPYFHVILLNT